MFIRLTVISVVTTVSLLLGVSATSGAAATPSAPACAPARSSAEMLEASLSCWQPASATTISAARQSQAVAVAKRHNRIRGAGLKRIGAPSMMVAADGMVAVTWSVAGPGVNPLSHLLVLLSDTITFRSVQQNVYAQTSDGGMTHRQWQNHTLRSMTYTADELTNAGISALRQAPAAHSAATPASGRSGWECAGTWGAAMLAGLAAAIACGLMAVSFPWGCLAAMAVAATAFYQANQICPA